MAVWQWVLKGVAVLSGALFFAGYLGALHPAGDSLAVARLPLAVIFALSVIWTDWSGPARWVISAAPITGLAHLALLSMVTGAPGPVTLYQKNLLFKNAETAGLVADIRAAAPDLVFLQEVSPSNRAALAEMQDLLPHQLVCDFTSWASVAVLSRWPQAGEGVCVPGLAALPVETPDGPGWAVSLHLHWPWPYQQPEHLESLAPILAGLEGPVYVGGDFNMVPWGWSVRRVAALTRTQRAGAVRRTVVKRGVPLSIDHVLSPEGGRIETRPRLGSDHWGVLGQVRP